MADGFKQFVMLKQGYPFQCCGDPLNPPGELRPECWATCDTTECKGLKGGLGRTQRSGVAGGYKKNEVVSA